MPSNTKQLMTMRVSKVDLSNGYWNPKRYWGYVNFVTVAHLVNPKKFFRGLLLHNQQCVTRITQLYHGYWDERGLIIVAFNCVMRVIHVCFGFALLRYLIG